MDRGKNGKSRSLARRLFALLLMLALAASMLIQAPEQTEAAGSNQISFSRIANARDLGGYKTKDGSTVRKGMLIRCGELAYASAGDLKKLKNTYHVGTVIDFRYTTDHKYCPDKKISGAKNVNIPAKYAKKPSKSGPKKRYKKLKKKSNSKLRSASASASKKVSRSYTVALVTSKYSKAQYKKFFNQLLANKGGKAVLFHCTYGKDRTGVAAFMTLIALGVDEETAYKEYAQTNTYLRKCSPKKYAKGKLGVRESDLRYAVKQVKKSYGSLENFLKKAYGLDEAKLKKLREIYTVAPEPPAAPETEPAAEETGAPAQAEDAAPVQNGDSVPAQTEEPAPAQNEDAAPAQDADASPSQNVDALPPEENTAIPEDQEGDGRKGTLP